MSTDPSTSPQFPFVKHNVLNGPRKCMPTLVSYPNSHAYRQRDNGKPGEGQLWNKRTKKWEEPSINEREQMMGYTIDATKAGHVTILQRTMRLGQAMDANTMRWFGAFLFATQMCLPQSTPDTPTGGGFTRKWCNKRSTSERTCAVVEKLLSIEESAPDTSMGGGWYTKRSEKENHRHSWSNYNWESNPGW